MPPASVIARLLAALVANFSNTKAANDAVLGSSSSSESESSCSMS